LYYGYTETDADEMLRDSRYPTVCDANLYQLRFEAENGEPGLRMFFYTAHAESLRSINRKLSRDYPGLLCEIAEEFGVDELLVIGLANDELGYIVPPSDFLLNEDTPYLEKTMDYKGENHYEETNSVGPECALAVAEAFRAAMELLG
ncbi:MAG: hypothetical protein J6I98_04780, partial [Clostridia bacterium]|nr:hypothetical protein [Clostridia bacterium]